MIKSISAVPTCTMTNASRNLLLPPATPRPPSRRIRFRFACARRTAGKINPTMAPASTAIATEKTSTCQSKPRSKCTGRSVFRLTELSMRVPHMPSPTPTVPPKTASSMLSVIMWV